MAHKSNSHNVPWLTSSQTEMFSVGTWSVRSSCPVEDAPATCGLVFYIRLCWMLSLQCVFIVVVWQGFQPPMLVFMQSKDRAKDLFHELVYDGINVDVIHADRTPQQVPSFDWHHRNNMFITFFTLPLIWLIFIETVQEFVCSLA